MWRPGFVRKTYSLWVGHNKHTRTLDYLGRIDKSKNSICWVNKILFVISFSKLHMNLNTCLYGKIWKFIEYLCVYFYIYGEPYVSFAYNVFTVMFICSWVFYFVYWRFKISEWRKRKLVDIWKVFLVTEITSKNRSNSSDYTIYFTVLGRFEVEITFSLLLK